MRQKVRPLDLERVRTVSVADRSHRVTREHLAGRPRAGASFAAFVQTLPRVLKAVELREVVEALADAVVREQPVILGMGAHVIKCGLSPVVIDLMERGIVSAVALNGGGAIHDVELALFGATSEDVEANLLDGRYGMVTETGAAMRQAIERAPDGVGLGAALGRYLLEADAPHREVSLLCAAAALGVPITVHVAIGTDTLHMLPGIDGGRLGALSHHDFRLLAAVVAQLQGGGVYCNIGSAVILPEVFLKCVTLARNLGYPVGGFTTVDMDMVRHYRPMTNVVGRHAALGAKGYALTGHHELMLPLLAFALVERLEQGGRSVAATERSREGVPARGTA